MFIVDELTKSLTRVAARNVVIFKYFKNIIRCGNYDRPKAMIVGRKNNGKKLFKVSAALTIHFSDESLHVRHQTK